MTEKLLQEILTELRYQSKVLEKLFNLNAKKAAPQIPQEYMEMMNSLSSMTKGSPFEKPFAKILKDLEEKSDGH